MRPHLKHSSVNTVFPRDTAVISSRTRPPDVQRGDMPVADGLFAGGLGEGGSEGGDCDQVAVDGHSSALLTAFSSSSAI